MALPKTDVPIYDLKLPLTKKDIKFRPFLVKEEKLLLMAVESKEDLAIINTIKQVVNNCVITEFNIDEFPMVDIEFIFLNLRARSVGEVVELKFKCNNNVEVEDGKKKKKVELKKCNNVMTYSINLLEIIPTIPENHTNKIVLSSKLGMILKYPTLDVFNGIDKRTDSVESIIEILVKCIDYIYDENEIYYAKDTPEAELVDFIENLTQTQFKKVQEFFFSIPKIKTTLNFKCSKCNYEESLEVEGIQNFFT